MATLAWHINAYKASYPRETRAAAASKVAHLDFDRSRLNLKKNRRSFEWLLSPNHSAFDVFLDCGFLKRQTLNVETFDWLFFSNGACDRPKQIRSA